LEKCLIGKYQITDSELRNYWYYYEMLFIKQKDLEIKKIFTFFQTNRQHTIIRNVLQCISS